MLRGVDAAKRVSRGFSSGQALIVAQMGVSLVLLVGAGLFVRSFRQALMADLGFSQEPAAIMRIDARGSGYEHDAWPDLYERLYRSIEQQPAVERLVQTDRLPLDFWNSGVRFAVPSLDLFGGDGFGFVQSAAIGAEFFEVLGIPIISGRGFTDADGRDRPRVAIVNEAAAEWWWPDRSAVGQAIRVASDPNSDIRVVGVSGNAKIRSIGEGPRPYVYLPLDQVSTSTIQFVAKGTVSATELVSVLRRAATVVDPDLFIVEARTLEEQIGFILLLPRLAALVFTLFGVLALLLAGIGPYVVVSFSVAGRTREIGIRLALGADGGEVAAYVPASRASRVSPVEALKSE